MCQGTNLGSLANLNKNKFLLVVNDQVIDHNHFLPGWTIPFLSLDTFWSSFVSDPVHLQAHMKQISQNQSNLVT